jgi:hypothetical protein
MGWKKEVSVVLVLCILVCSLDVFASPQPSDFTDSGFKSFYLIPQSFMLKQNNSLFEMYFVNTLGRTVNINSVNITNVLDNKECLTINESFYNVRSGSSFIIKGYPCFPVSNANQKLRISFVYDTISNNTVIESNLSDEGNVGFIPTEHIEGASKTDFTPIFNILLVAAALFFVFVIAYFFVLLLEYKKNLKKLLGLILLVLFILFVIWQNSPQY